MSRIKLKSFKNSRIFIHETINRSSQFYYSVKVSMHTCTCFFVPFISVSFKVFLCGRREREKEKGLRLFTFHQPQPQNPSFLHQSLFHAQFPSRLHLFPALVAAHRQLYMSAKCPYKGWIGHVIHLHGQTGSKMPK